MRAPGKKLFAQWMPSVAFLLVTSIVTSQTLASNDIEVSFSMESKSFTLGQAVAREALGREPQSITLSMGDVSCPATHRGVSIGARAGLITRLTPAHIG